MNRFRLREIQQTIFAVRHSLCGEKSLFPSSAACGDSFPQGEAQLVEKVRWGKNPLRLTAFGTSPIGRGFDRKSVLL